jgi:hypothetical protein
MKASRDVRAVGREGVRRMLKAPIVFASEQTSGVDHASLFAKQLPIPVNRNGAPP